MADESKIPPKQEPTKVVAEKQKELNLPVATYKVQVRNNADIKDVLSRQEQAKKTGQ